MYGYVEPGYARLLDHEVCASVAHVRELVQESEVLTGERGRCFITSHPVQRLHITCHSGGFEVVKANQPAEFFTTEQFAAGPIGLLIRERGLLTQAL